MISSAKETFLWMSLLRNEKMCVKMMVIILKWRQCLRGGVMIMWRQYKIVSNIKNDEFVWRHLWMTSNLLSINDLLLEDSVVVSDAITVRRHGQRGHRVQETSGKSSKSTVSEASIGLHVLELFDIKTKLGKKYYSITFDSKIFNKLVWFTFKVSYVLQAFETLSFADLDKINFVKLPYRSFGLEQIFNAASYASKIGAFL